MEGQETLKAQQELVNQLNAEINARGIHINENRYENDKLIKYLDSFMNQVATLVAIGGLVGIFLVGNMGTFFLYFLNFVFPYLIISVCFFVPSLRRGLTARDDKVSVPFDAVNLNEYFKGIQSFSEFEWEKTYMNYKRTLIFLRLGQTFVIAYLIALVSSAYYISITRNTPSLDLTLMFNAILILFIFCRFKFLEQMSEKFAK